MVLLADAAGWEHASRSITWRPRFEAPYFETQEAMLSPRQVPVDVYVARYLRQRPRSKLISSHNELSPEWQVIGTDEQSVPIGGGTRSVRETRIAFADERRLVWEWFLVGGHATHSRPRAKLLEVRGLMRGRRDGAVIALSAPCLGGCDQARAAMTELLESAGARLEAVANGQVDGLAGGAAHDAIGSVVGENR